MDYHAAREPVVVLGFGAAAISGVLALRGKGYAGRIVVVTDAGPDPYSPVLTSYYAGGRITRDRCNAWADVDLAGAIDELHANARVMSVDPVAHEIEFDDGRRMRYAKLLVATGAHPVAPGFPRDGDIAPLMLRTMTDAELFKSVLEDGSCREVLVSGTSMVGLKALEACLDRGIHVTMLGRSAHILRRSAHPAVAEAFERLLRERSVTLRLEQTAQRASRTEKPHGCEVAFDSGETVRFDAVVLAQGVKPNLGFMPIDAAQRDRGLDVDRFMHTAAPDVFAAGDIARTLDLSIGEKRVAGLWREAVQQGRCAGRAIAAELAGQMPKHPYPGFVPGNIIHVRDLLFASAGLVADAPGRRIDVVDANGVLTALAWEERAGGRRLVGFNMLAIAKAPGDSATLDEAIGRYRGAIRVSYLDVRGKG